VAAAWFVWCYGTSIPRADKWTYVSLLTGKDDITLEWLWQVEYDHRMPLQKFIFVAAFRPAQACLAAGIGWGRGGSDENYGGGYPGLLTRLAVLAAPGLCALDFIGATCTGPVVRRLLSMCMFTTAAMLWPLNAQVGWEEGHDYHEAAAAFERGLRAGVPATLLTERHRRHIYFGDEEKEEKGEMTGYFEALREAGLEPFPQLRDDPEWEEVNYPLGLGAILEMAWTGHDDGGIGPACYPRFNLERPRFVYAIRFRCSYTKTADNEAAFRSSLAE
jgi:hypothetical protein